MNNAFKVKYVILADDVREEINGKMTIVGTYHEKLLIPSTSSSTFSIPISFFIYGSAPDERPTAIELWIENPDKSKGPTITFERIEPRTVSGATVAMVIWKLTPWKAGGVGHYKLRMKQNNKVKSIYEFEIEKNPN